MCILSSCIKCSFDYVIGCMQEVISVLSVGAGLRCDVHCGNLCLIHHGGTEYVHIDCNCRALFTMFIEDIKEMLLVGIVAYCIIPLVVIAYPAVES